MNPAEKEQLLSLLQASRGALRHVTGQMSDAQATFAPAEGQWSAKDVAEHVAVAEEQMLFLITQLRRPATQPSPLQDAPILKVMDDRTHKREAPPSARPAARFATLSEALAHFESSRAKTLDYVASCTENLRGFTVKHPLAGVIDCYQCLLMIATHPLRHEKQIQELKGHPAFPRA